VIEAPPIHAAVAFLLDHLPPQLHLLIATRSDPPLPLSRLRARGELTELRAADLRFTPDEAAAFLTAVMGLPLAADQIAALERHTEGWIADLQFAALAMRDRSDLAGFIAAFTGSNRFVMDYLADEVVDRLPPHLQTFVMETSIDPRSAMRAALRRRDWGLGTRDWGSRLGLPIPSPQFPVPNAS
jgi:LuxR family maltose regulon positive regulatory protein